MINLSVLDGGWRSVRGATTFCKRTISRLRGPGSPTPVGIPGRGSLRAVGVPGRGSLRGRCSGSGEPARGRCSGSGEPARGRCSGSGESARGRCSGSGESARGRCSGSGEPAAPRRQSLLRSQARYALLPAATPRVRAVPRGRRLKARGRRARCPVTCCRADRGAALARFPAPIAGRWAVRPGRLTADCAAAPKRRASERPAPVSRLIARHSTYAAAGRCPTS
jgi:hypothetical protein